MKQLSYLLKLIKYSRIYIAIGSVFVSYSISVLLGLSFPPLLAVTVFSTVFAAYAMNQHFDMEEDEANDNFGNEVLAKNLFNIGATALVFAFVSAFLVSLEVFVFVSALVGLLLLYSAKIFPSGLGYRRLKEVPFVKNIIISLNLGLIWVLSLLIYNLNPSTGPILILLVFMTIRVFIGSVIPDIRDIEGDSQEGINTIPVLYGIGKTKNILFAANFAGLAIYLYAVFANILPSSAALAGLINLATFPVIFLTTENNADTMTLVTEINTIFTFPALLLVAVMI